MILKSETHTVEDANGNITKDTKETSYQKISEPDYIKIYTKMWCEFNQIPIAYRDLFLELATRMTYCNTHKLKESQIVYTSTPTMDAICEKLKWKAAMYYKGLKALCDAGAIKRVSRGVYQINPNYAGKGGWTYNPREDKGGVKDLVATFNFKDKTVNTKIVWADDGQDTELNQAYREGLQVNKEEQAILTAQEIQSA